MTWAPVLGYSPLWATSVRLIVSSDHDGILHWAELHGHEPRRRPDELATDDGESWKAFKDAALEDYTTGSAGERTGHAGVGILSFFGSGGVSAALKGGIEELSKLEHLEINGCRNVADVTSAGELRNLRELQLIDAGNIPSLAPLANLEKLEKLMFYGDTKIEDGDLSVLESLPNLREVGFAERRHYSHREADLLEA